MTCSANLGPIDERLKTLNISIYGNAKLDISIKSRRIYFTFQVH